MKFFIWGIIGVLGCTVAVLGYKLYGVRRAAEEIQREFALRLEMDTNTLIHLSHQDPAMRKLAAQTTYAFFARGYGAKGGSHEYFS